MIWSRVLSVAAAPLIPMFQCRQGQFASGMASNIPRVRSIAEAFPTRVCGVLRTEDSDAGFQAALAALEAGIGTTDITKTAPSCFELLQGLIASTGGKYPVGVGTVWDPGAV